MIFIFDLDGTLIDSSTRHCFLLEKLLFEKGIAGFCCQDYLEYKANGYSTLDYLLNILFVEKQLGIDICAEWIEKIEDERTVLLYDKLFDDSRDTLKTISENCDIYYVSCRQSKIVLLKELKQLGIDCYTKKVFICDPKKGIEGKTKALDDILKQNNSEAVFIGDTEIDLVASNNSKIRFFALNRGFRSKSFWNKKGLNSFSSLRQILDLVLH